MTTQQSVLVPWLGEVPIRQVPLGVGKPRITWNTVQIMRKQIRESSAHELVRKTAERLVANIQDRDRWGEASTIFRWVQSTTRYAPDPLGTEYVQSPPYVLEQVWAGMRPSLDCDDYTVLTLALLRSLGFETAIRAVGLRGQDRFSHVYGLAKINGAWVPFDAVRKDQTLGWEVPVRTRIMDLPIEGASGLGDLATPAEAITMIGVWGSFASIFGLVVALAMLAKPANAYA